MAIIVKYNHDNAEIIRQFSSYDEASSGLQRLTDILIQELRKKSLIIEARIISKDKIKVEQISYGLFKKYRDHLYYIQIIPLSS